MRSNVCLAIYFLLLSLLLSLSGKSVVAQNNIAPDATLGSERSRIVPDAEDMLRDVIQGGARRGGNLFHSFRDFNIGTGRAAYFANPAGVENILGRVTGSNLSEIDGTLGVLGNANFFLINPNGILFGQNARLDVSGSFLASTAESFRFGGDGEFSAQGRPGGELLSVNVPQGLQWGERSAPITTQGSNLSVQEGNSLALAGGDTRLEDSRLEAPGGRVELSGVAPGSLIEFGSNGGSITPENIAQADVTLTNSAVDVVSSIGGTIAINAENVELLEGSSLLAGSEGIIQAQSGDIFINAADTVSLNQGSNIENNSGGKGDAGNVEIEARSLILNGSILSASTFGEGNAGTVRVNAKDSVLLEGESAQGLISAIASLVFAPGAQGNSGGVEIATKSLILKDGANLSANTFGQGDAGAVKVTAQDSVILEGESSQGGPSSISSQVTPDAQGNAGGVEIEAQSLILKDGAFLSTSTLGDGNAGTITVNTKDSVLIEGEDSQGRLSNINSAVASDAQGNSGGVEIEAQSLILKDGAFLSANTFGEGNAGTVKLKAQDSVILEGESSQERPSEIVSQVGPDAQGDSGGVEIEAQSLILKDGASLSVSTLGEGNAGTVTVNAQDSVLIEGEDSQGRSTSAIASQVGPDAQGSAGDVEIEAQSLILKDGAFLSANTFGEGDAGNIRVNAQDSVLIEGEDSQGRTSEIASGAFSDGQGNAGDIEIEAQSLILKDGASLSANTGGQGDAGNIRVNAKDSVLIEGEDSQGRSTSAIASQVGPDAQGDAGGIEIEAQSLILKDGASLSASTGGEGDAGNIRVNAKDSVLIEGDTSFVATQVAPDAQGNAGGVEIEAQSFILKDGAFVSASTFGQGKAGTVKINAKDSILIEGEDSQGRISGIDSLVAPDAQGNAGDVEIEAQSLILKDGALLTTTTLGEGNAGNIIVQVQDVINLSGEDTGIFANTTRGSTGNGGSIFIDPISISISDGAEIAVSSDGTGQGGEIRLEAGSLTLDRGTISAETVSNLGGNIDLDINNLLLLRNNSLITATAGTNQGGGDGGNINISSPILFAFPQGNSDIAANAFEGQGGNIDIASQGVFGIAFRDSQSPVTNDITASSEFGTEGSVTFNTPETDPNSGLINLPVQPTETKVAQTCSSGGPQAQNEFVNTGRGGVPATAQESLNNDNIDGTWVSLNPQETETQASQASQKIESEPKSKGSSSRQATAPDPIVEARGWVTRHDGNLMLTAPEPPPESPSWHTASC